MTLRTNILGCDNVKKNDIDWDWDCYCPKPPHPGPHPSPGPGPRPRPRPRPKPGPWPGFPPKSRCRRKPRRRGQIELLGLIMLVVGVITIGIFILPYKAWLIVLGLVMIFCGYKLFIC